MRYESFEMYIPLHMEFNLTLLRRSKLKSLKILLLLLLLTSFRS